jgi:hypothetical protein
MKKINLIIVGCASFMLAQQPLKAQESVTPGNVQGRVFYAELGGPGVVSSINFDSRVKAGQRRGLGYRAGVGFGLQILEQDDYTTQVRTFYTIPVGLNYVLGKENSAHTFEVGAGTSFLTRKVSLYYYSVKTPGHFIGHLSFMYRIVPVDGGFSFRTGFTPIIGTSGDLFPMVAVSFGYSF